MFGWFSLFDAAILIAAFLYILRKTYVETGTGITLRLWMHDFIGRTLKRMRGISPAEVD